MQYTFFSTAFFPCYGEGSVRVANTTYSYSDGGSSYSGRVEVCYNGSYGSVCDVGWNDEDASVVCQNYFGYFGKYTSDLDRAVKNSIVHCIIQILC